MAGLSIKQISNFLSVNEVTARKIISERCHPIKVKGGYLRVPTDEFVDALIAIPRHAVKFIDNVERGTIQSNYILSAHIVRDMLLERSTKEMLQNDIDITTANVMDLASNIGFESQDEVRKACRDKKLMAFKAPSEHGKAERWWQWLISADALALYLKVNPDYENNFLRSYEDCKEYWKGFRPDMIKIANFVKEKLESTFNPSDEEFTIQDVSVILDIPENQVEATFVARNPFAKLKAKVKPVISMDAFVSNLRDHPEIIPRIYDRWAQMAREKDPLEAKVRHALMLQEYQKRNH